MQLVFALFNFVPDFVPHKFLMMKMYYVSVCYALFLWLPKPRVAGSSPVIRSKSVMRLLLDSWSRKVAENSS